MKRTPLTRSAPLQAKTPMRKVSAKRKAYRASDEGQADLAHMARVAQLQCVICGFWPTEVHNVIHGRYSARKSPDTATIPLCRAHHAELHAGKESWAAKWGPDYGYLPYVRNLLNEQPRPE
jgi:hypothetical protein